jgi:excinuclease ABC subunit B
MDHFELVAPYEPTGDQPEAIRKLVEGFKMGLKEQTLLGVTGSGKTFTMANIIAQVNRPTLILAHNKTLAAQLCTEMREYFPHNAVEYFISYYDYYQPEAYIAHTDTYIEKDSAVNDEIERLRHSATSSLFERRDVIVVASVSCIYGLGDPIDYQNMVISLRTGMVKPRDELTKKLVEIRYERNDLEFARNHFRVRGDTVEIYPVYWSGRAIRVEFFGDEIERISEINAVTGVPERVVNHVAIYPASHYVASREKLNRAIIEIEREMEEREAWFKAHDKLLEAQRIRQRTMYDIEMLQEIGFCSGIENYSRVISGRAPGTPPMTLLDYFPKDFLLFVDESHVTLPQVRAMYAGDRSRKESLVDYGFRLPSAFDNRPLTFPEFQSKIGQAVYVSATPAEFERERAGQVVEQVIRPTGLLDPRIDVRPIEGQIDDLIGECNAVIARQERVLVTTLTKKMAEDLTTYLQKAGIRVRYMHSDVAALERMEILRDLRLAKFDVLVGINLLREGLDLPEVSLVAILDADKEGFLRSETSLIQTIGRAARNAGGRVIMYADKITPAMRAAIDETERRRAIQDAYNRAHGIVPKTIIKDVRELIEITQSEGEAKRADGVKMTRVEREREIARLEKEMKAAARMMEYEYAAVLRDRIMELRAAETPKSSPRGKKA